MMRLETPTSQPAGLAKGLGITLVCALLAISLVGGAFASSHREAPGITAAPQVDGTDFYMFRSYEPGREDFVTFIANYNPLQDPYGGPNYYTMDDDALYQIQIDNTGDGVEDLTFGFQFSQFSKDIAIPVGDQMVKIPLKFAGPIMGRKFGPQNVVETYDAHAISGPLTAPTNFSEASFNGRDIGVKPSDNVGMKTFPDYDAYAANFMYNVTFDGLNCNGRVFVGQRKDSFSVNLGEVFDLVNTNPVGPIDAEQDDLADKNVTTIALEVPISCVKGSGDVIGAWTTASLPNTRVLEGSAGLRLGAKTDDQTLGLGSALVVGSVTGPFVQVSRLGMPLVNEVVIGLADKNAFNASRPVNDLADFATYVTNPTLPALLEILFGVRAPTNFPRTDLVAAFVTGISGLNQFGIGEMLRLNVGILPTAAASQSSYGVAGGDLAGFPNGRRPGDDVVDVSLRVAMGILCHAFSDAAGCTPADAPDGLLPYTDGVLQSAGQFDAAFPYLTTPIPGSPSDADL